jgi:DNA-binding transcriptional LysR family regulator
MDRIAGMTTFVKVVDAGGFAAAARALNLSPSVVTTHVQSLEERLSVRLLNRSTRRINLTEVGQAYYESCVRILADLDQADQVAEGLQSKPRGTLRLNTTPAMPAVLAPVIAEFVTLYPEASVNVSVTSRMVDLLEEGFDLALRPPPTSDSSLIIRRLANYSLVVCGAPDYLARRGTPQRPGDLAQHNCMSYVDSPWGAAEWHFVKADAECAVPIVGNLQANNAESLRHAALAGQGLICSPKNLVCHELRSGRLVAVLAQFPMPEFAIAAIYPHRQLVPAKVRSFIDLAAKHFHTADWTSPIDNRPLTVNGERESLAI